MNESKEIISVLASKMTAIVDSKEKVEFLLVNNEEIELAFNNYDDYIWFTNKRLVIYIKESGLWGSKGTFMIYPFSKISSFSAVTTNTTKSRDVMIYINGLPQININFHKSLPIEEILHLLSSRIL